MKLHTMKTAMARRVQKGVTMIEYALIAALVAVAAVAALGLLGDKVTNTFTSVTNKMP